MKPRNNEMSCLSYICYSAVTDHNCHDRLQVHRAAKALLVMLVHVDLMESLDNLERLDCQVRKDPLEIRAIVVPEVT